MTLWNEFIYSLRMLRKELGTSLLVVLTLALGMGATAAVFSVIYAVLLKPLPYPDSGRIVALYEVKTAHDEASQSDVAPGNFLDWREQNRSFSAIAGFAGFHYILTGVGAPQHLWGGAVSAGWWKVFGVQPELGRVFTAEEDRPNAPQVAVLTDRLWRTRFHADPQIVGRPIRLNGETYTVVGVMPPDPTTLHTEIDFWTPLERQILPRRMRWRDARFLRTFARLRPGISLAQAAGELSGISAAIHREHLSEDVFGGSMVTPLRRVLTGDVRDELLIAFAIVALLLLVACTNVANLMLVRMSSRARELAIRTALGAQLLHILRQLLIESLCLALFGAVAGLSFAAVLIQVVRHFGEAQMLELEFAQINPYVIAFMFALAILTGVIFGLGPAMTVVHANAEDVLRKASLTMTAHRGHRRLRHGIAVAEIACSLVLLAGAGLLLRSLTALQRVPLGFATDHRAIASISLPRMKYQQDRDVIRFYDEVVNRVRAIPGVSDAAVIDPPPLDDDEFATSFVIPGAVGSPQYEPVGLRLTDPHYFSVLKIPILRGRGFTDQDRIDSAPVCIVNQAMARRYWQHQDPIGRFLVLTRGDAAATQRPRQIIGVVADVRDQINLEPESAVYVPYRQMPFPSMKLVMHTAAPLGSLRPAIESAVQSADADEPLGSLRTLDSLVVDAQQPWRLALTLLGGLAGLALLLSSVGVFGVMSHLVREKTKETGIRIALGATTSDIRLNILAVTAGITFAGIALGIGLSAAATRFLGSLIYGVASADPLTFALVAALLAGVALLASYIPARRAIGVDPMEALRCD